MSTTTTNYQLHKPELSDPADITKLNPNWDKIDNQLKQLNTKFVDIPANADLNNYTDIGKYVCSINARVATLTNCPTNIAFYMTVGKHAGVYQRLVQYNAIAPKIYFRNKDDNGSWGAWHREYTTVDKPSPSDLGALSVNGGTVGDLTVSAPNLKPLKAVNSTAVPCYTHYSGKDGALGFIGFNEKDAPAFLNSAGNQVYKLYHTGNKPTPADIGAASASHGTHVPTPQTANSATFLRNDNTWQTVTPANIGAASKSNVNNVTLTASNWSSSKTFTIANSYIASTNTIVEIAPQQGITEAQLKALQSANIVDGGMSKGTIVLKAMGDKPTIDIPIVVIVRGDT